MAHLSRVWHPLRDSQDWIAAGAERESRRWWLAAAWLPLLRQCGAACLLCVAGCGWRVRFALLAFDASAVCELVHLP